MYKGLRSWLLAFLVGASACGVAQSAAAPKFDDIAQHAAEAFRQNHLDEAVALYRQAVKLRPDWPEGWGYLAASLYAMHQYADARGAYKRTTELTPQNGLSWAFLGFCEYELRDYRHAFDHLVKGEKLGLGNNQELLFKVHYEMALLWDTAGQFDMAMKQIAFLAEAGDKSPPVIEATGLIVLRMPIFPYEIPAAKHDLVMQAGEAGWAVNARHADEANKLYEALIAKYPEEPNLHYSYGFSLAAIDQEAAVGQLEKEIEISPKHAPAIIEAAFLCLEMSELEKSEKLARRAIEIEPKNYAPHNILGRVEMQTGNSADGIRELETAVRLAPSIATAHFNLAQAYQKAGKSAEAEREFAAFKKLDQRKEDNGATAANP